VPHNQLWQNHSSLHGHNNLTVNFFALSTWNFQGKK
jgi:hypothetical protein